MGTVVENQVSACGYRIEAFLGTGAFGAAYQARRLGTRGNPVGDPVCLKLITRADVWHGEAYFAGLLRELSNVVRMRDAFPTSVRVGRSSQLVFVIEMELVATGTVSDACTDGRLPWPEERVARKVRGLLKPLSVLHNMGVSHRDVTPGNVYVAPRAVLKLGDFGITKAGLRKSGVPADEGTPYFLPKDMGAWWRPADDVFQVGLLMMTLLEGREVGREVRLPAVNRVTSKELGLREAVKKALRVRSQRAQSADELLALIPR